MANSTIEILQECQKELEALRERMQALEERISLLYEAAAEEPVPVEMPEEMPIEIPEEVPVEMPEEFPEDLPEEAPIEVELPAEDLPVAEPVPEPANLDPEPVIPDPDRESPAPDPVPDEMPAGTEGMAWRKDRPGLPVKNIRSGISLFDRALFIGSLFKEDGALYEQTIAELNHCETLNQAVAYIVEHFPDWDLKSGVVYNFMMAIRKKLG